MSYKNSKWVTSWEECFYCGSPANERDHCPPQSLDATASVSSKFDIPRLIVPCCRACNEALGSKPLITIRDRCNFLLERLFDQFLNETDWTIHEYEEMGPGMQQYIRSKQLHHSKVWSRIEHLRYRRNFTASHF